MMRHNVGHSSEYGLIHFFAQWILRILRNVYFSHATRYFVYFGINFRKLLLTMSQHVILDSVILPTALHINTKESKKRQRPTV